MFVAGTMDRKRRFQKQQQQQDEAADSSSCAPLVDPVVPTAGTATTAGLKRGRMNDSTASSSSSSTLLSAPNNHHENKAFEKSGDGVSCNSSNATTNRSNKRIKGALRWDEDIHRAFVRSIYDVGVRHASPSVILDNMTEKSGVVTSERVKSHLQKYRNNREKSRAEFMAEYEIWLKQARTVGAAGGAHSRLAPAMAVVEMMGSEKLVGGDLAGFLTYSCLVEDEQEQHGSSATMAGEVDPAAHLSADAIKRGSQQFANYLTGARIPFPRLSEEEKKSPLGVSITHVMSVFYSMTQYLMQQRQDAKEKKMLVEGAGDGEVVIDADDNDHALAFTNSNTKDDTNNTDNCGHQQQPAQTQQQGQQQQSHLGMESNHLYNSATASTTTAGTTATADNHFMANQLAQHQYAQLMAGPQHVRYVPLQGVPYLHPGVQALGGVGGGLLHQHLSSIQQQQQQQQHHEQQQRQHNTAGDVFDRMTTAADDDEEEEEDDDDQDSFAAPSGHHSQPKL